MTRHRRIVRMRTLMNGCIITDVKYVKDPCEMKACKIETEEMENGMVVETYYVEE